MLLTTSAYWLSALLLAALAVCWAYVLVQPDMLLAPVQAWVRAWYRKPYRPAAYIKNPGWSEFWPEFVRGQGPEVSKEIDNQWWWKPLWGCYVCVAGQWGFWGYLLLFPLASYSLLAHLGFTAITILFAALWRAVYAWSQNQ
jgi:hypothetical protein